jgi:hypothetical protein
VFVLGLVAVALVIWAANGPVDCADTIQGCL